MIYFIIFMLSILLLWISTKVQNKVIKKCIVFFSLLIPCFIAAFRGLSVGTDTGGYVFNLFNNAKNIKNFHGMINFSEWLYYSTDYAYLFINFIIAKCHFSFQFLLFIYEFLIILPIYYALKINSKCEKEIIYGMFLFYLAFYNLSLNMVRQSIAIAFVLLSFSILKNVEGKKGKIFSLIFFILGCGFHDTAIVASPILILYFIFNRKKIDDKTKKMIAIIITAISIFIAVFYKPIFNFLGTTGLYPKAIMYLNKYSTFDFNYLGTVRNVLLLFVVYNSKKIYDSNNEFLFVIELNFVNILMGLLGSFVTYSDRVSYYMYFMILILYIPQIIRNKKMNYNFLLTILFFTFYWFVLTVVNNSNQTLPYVFFR